MIKRGRKKGAERLQSCSGEERNQNGVSEGMCKLGQTLLRLLLLLLPSPPSATSSAASLPLSSHGTGNVRSGKASWRRKKSRLYLCFLRIPLQLCPPSRSLALSLVSVCLSVSLPLNLISKAHHVLSAVSRGTWPPSISPFYTHPILSSPVTSRDGRTNNPTLISVSVTILTKFTTD